MARIGSRQSIPKSSASHRILGPDSLRGSRLSFEMLEPRQMLAADMADILGVVHADMQGDGIGSNDTVVVGATAALYRDGGNNVFDGGSGDDALVSSVATNSLGEYRFEQIGAGRYFVKVTLPADLQFRLGEEVKEVVITANEVNGIVGPAIDGFTSSQVVQATPPLPASDPATLLDATVLGGERDLFVELTTSQNLFSSVSLASNGGKLYFASGSGVTGTAKVVWDGIDSNGQLVNPTGLGGIDLTAAGGNTMTGIALTSGADHPDAKIKMRIYTDANNWSEFTTTVPESVGGTASGQAVFHFDDVPTTKSGSGADFTNVGALELTFEGVSAVDAQVTLVGLVGRATKQLDFTASPRLSVGDRVWADRDDDGILDQNIVGGEVGIAGVKLNLYEDSNGDNQFTQSADALFGTTTTDAAGNYLFSDLFPGKYIVQVDPTNFQVLQPLHGLTSSSGNDPASDPDDNVNNDDNGATLAGAGVVSQAVTLAGDSEPTNDGDSSNDSNLTVDFGFFGFDLVLDKSVDQTVLSPQETVEYRIKINNDGPADAANTTFKDTLPSHVTFVSGTTSLSGVGVQHAGGIVTANLGIMKTGDVVFVTILATVNNDAIGTLVNTATVSAPKEVNLSNNTDTVSNPVQPKIDLAITKTDSRDPVEPGSTFSYTLDIVNNGPSDATGVVVTDDLPDVGVSYQSASLTPESFDGDQLTFQLGDLAKGESTSITINVRVDDDFSGQLLNHTEVSGNETEITLTNNQDTEPTLVKIDPASLEGTVFVDRNDNGTFDSGEATLSGVIITLKGVDVTGATVVRTTITTIDGTYLFDNLNPGTYRVMETQPNRYKDGQDHVGTQGGATGENPGLFLIPNDISSEQVKDLLFGITLGSGDVGSQYDFGELSHNISKADFVRPLFYQ